MKEKILISITGKSGAGKSVFSELLAKKLDAMLLNLDKISHLSLSSEQIKNQLETIFGSQIFDTDRNIKRKVLGQIVFNDEVKLAKLNAISQKFMEDYIDDKIASSNKKYIILEYALLTKMKYFNESKFKILIYANKQTRFSRLMTRDNVSEEYLLSREKNLPDYNNEDYDEIIENSSDFQQNLTLFAEKISKKIQTSIN